MNFESYIVSIYNELRNEYSKLGHEVTDKFIISVLCMKFRLPYMVVENTLAKYK